MMEAQRKLIHFNVGGHPYTLNIDDINKYPHSFFARSVDEKWRTSDAPIVIERDGDIFRYISAFITFGSLPRVNGKLALESETVAAIRVEADFYNLPELMKDCGVKDNAEDKVENFLTMRSYLEQAKEWGNYYSEEESCVYPTIEHGLSELVTALGTVWGPFCVRSTLNMESFIHLPLFKSSMISSLNIAELLEAAQESAFGRGTETVFDPTVRKSWEISTSKLNEGTLSQLVENLAPRCRKLAPHSNIELRPYKLVIYQDGGHFDPHRDSVRGDGHIGTLVLILNSEYTGGELEITHNGQTEVVTGPYSWVAMYGDCLHKINPVTSGTRVSLIFDIYAIPKQVRRGGAAFWEAGYYNQPRLKTTRYRGVTAGIRQLILDGLNQALDESDEVIICLAHKYPFKQTTSAFLKGGDKALYRMLREEFETKVVACTVVRHATRDYICGRVAADLFTLYSPPEEDSDGSVGSADGSDIGEGSAGNDEDGTNADVKEVCPHNTVSSLPGHRNVKVTISTVNSNVQQGGAGDEEDEESASYYEDYDEDDAADQGEWEEEGGDQEWDVGQDAEQYEEGEEEGDEAEEEGEQEEEHEGEWQELTSDAEDDVISQAHIAPPPETIERPASAGADRKRRARLVVVPRSINPESVLDYSPYIDHVGNESQLESTVYLVAGLQLRRRV
jgi:predicted 2-oxoglutarate/Fe(II)-dependent dioxygenase YbiX